MIQRGMLLLSKYPWSGSESIVCFFSLLDRWQFSYSDESNRSFSRWSIHSLAALCDGNERIMFKIPLSLTSLIARIFAKFICSPHSFVFNLSWWYCIDVIGWLSIILRELSKLIHHEVVWPKYTLSQVNLAFYPHCWVCLHFVGAVSDDNPI